MNRYKKPTLLLMFLRVLLNSIIGPVLNLQTVRTRYKPSTVMIHQYIGTLKFDNLILVLKRSNGM